MEISYGRMLENIVREKVPSGKKAEITSQRVEAQLRRNGPNNIPDIWQNVPSYAAQEFRLKVERVIGDLLRRRN